MDIKVLILRPSKKSYGGITSYFNTLEGKFNVNITYMSRGVRKQNSLISRSVYPFIQIYDYLLFSIKVLQHDLIQINTSLGWSGMLRDSIYIVIAKLFRKKVIVFFRGINSNFLKNLNKYPNKLLNLMFLKADGIIVLSKKLKKQLVEWNYSGKIYLETTAVDDKYLKQCTFHELLEKKQNTKKKNILFLARIEKYKGIYEIIDAFSLIANDFKDTNLILAGNGSEYNNLRKYIEEKTSIKNRIILKGFVEGKTKAELYKQAYMYILPSENEGMPNSLLEAMSYANPSIVTPVGGIEDFFIDGKMGFLLDKVDSSTIAQKIKYILNDSSLFVKMAEHNYNYASQHFLPNTVISRIENIYKDIL